MGCLVLKFTCYILTLMGIIYSILVFDKSAEMGYNYNKRGLKNQGI